MNISRKQLKKALRKSFKKGQLDQHLRSKPYLEKVYFGTRLASLMGKKKQLIGEQFLER